MIKKLIVNDINQNKFSSGAALFFMAVSAMLLVLTTLLFSGLAGAIDSLMEKAEVLDYMQMHVRDEGSAEAAAAWEREEAEISRFAESCREVGKWQICGSLNLDNNRITLGGRSLSDSTQDNGLCVQGEQFDYLLNMDGKVPEVLPGEVFVPVCYRGKYQLSEGDVMEIGDYRLVIAGFLRDAQMNSMMASSKRFLVNGEDYERIRNFEVQEEYLIEFLLEENADINAFAAAYEAEQLSANGPAITKPLIRMMNALSDGTMIFVIFLVSIVVMLISMLCVRFLCLTQMERERKEAGMLKALGVEGAQIRRIYMAKYIFLSGCGGLIGLGAAFCIKAPMEQQIRELYGVGESGLEAAVLAFGAAALAEGAILFSVRRSLKKTERMPALEAMFQPQEKKGGGQYLIIGLVTFACTFLLLVPQNLYNTMSSPDFVTYMGIGSGDIRMDIRQTGDIRGVTEDIASALAQDKQVERYTVLTTKACTAYLPSAESEADALTGLPATGLTPENLQKAGLKTVNLAVETGSHGIFPVEYLEGRLPERQGEIALSVMNARELGLSVGDSIGLAEHGVIKNHRVCGIYSDITNGGKTAKAYDAGGDGPVMWSVLYVSLKDFAEKTEENPAGRQAGYFVKKSAGDFGEKEKWMEKYRAMGADVTYIADYVQDTYGQTLGQLRLAQRAAALISTFVTGAVVWLFIRLLVEKDRYAISLHKALGFTGADMKRSYFVKGMLPVIGGMTAGIFIGNPLGERICGAVMKSFGAEGFRFAASQGLAPAGRLAVIAVPAILAVWGGAAFIGRIKAFECCNRRE
ncbi:MAG: ABC transporter permease [Lachnospiraceae bacterium]|nr:ABC transporter permease [Lachnospiraceae bacterium]